MKKSGGYASKFLKVYNNINLPIRQSNIDRYSDSVLLTITLTMIKIIIIILNKNYIILNLKKKTR